MRKSNYELLRIVCMIMIVILHTVGHGGALVSTDINSYNFIICHFLKGFSIVAVNCYILIAGFFGIDNEFRLNKLLKLYSQIIFYSISITIIFWCMGIESITKKSVIACLMPLINNTWWFVTLYIIMYILSPYKTISY